MFLNRALLPSRMAPSDADVNSMFFTWQQQMLIQIRTAPFLAYHNGPSRISMKL